MAYKARRLFKPKKGLDLKSAETMRGEDHLSYADNIVYSDQGEIAKRPGTHLRVYGINSYSGMTLFETTDYKGVSKSEIVFVGTNAGEGPRRVIKRYLTVTNGNIPPLTCSVVYNPTWSRFEMILNGSPISFGTGLVGGNLTIAGLIALSGGGVTFASASSIGTVPAAFLENKTEVIPSGGTASFAYYSSEEITYGGYGTEPSFTPVFPRSNPTTALINGSLYWYASHTGTESILLKYDGQCWYKAGLPFITDIRSTSLKVNGDFITDIKGFNSLSQDQPWDDNQYSGKIFARLSYKDKSGSVHYSDFFERSSGSSSSVPHANGAVALYINSITSTTVGLGLTKENARGAKANGGGSTIGPVLTIPVDAGHTLIIGDVAYFWHSGISQFIEREITNIGATSITISSNIITDGDIAGAVNLYDNCIISNNFRVEYYYANELGSPRPGISFPITATLLATIPINVIDSGAGRAAHPDIYVAYPTWATGNYKAIASTWIFSGNTSYPPPNGKFVASTNNGSSLIISGNLASDNTVYSSTGEDAEAFYIGKNAFTVDGTVTGIGSSGAVTFVATNKQTYAVQGDIPNLNFRVEKITENLGVIAPASVCEIDEGAIHFNTIKGPFMLLGGRELKPVGEWPLDNRISAIEPYFTYNYTPRNDLVYQPSFEVASAYVIKEKKLIILNIPWNASSTFSYLYTGTLIYDYSMGGWFTWSGIDATCGAVYWDDKVWLAGQGAGGTINLVSMQTPTVATNYHDHGTPITATVRYHWENGGDINSYKKFLWLTVYSPPGNGSNYNYNVKTYVNYETASSNSWKVPTAQHTSFTATATPPAYTVEAKLKSGKFASIMVEISNATSQEGMWISGTELDIAPTYRIPSRPGRKDT